MQGWISTNKYRVKYHDGVDWKWKDEEYLSYDEETIREMLSKPWFTNIKIALIETIEVPYFMGDY